MTSESPHSLQEVLERAPSVQEFSRTTRPALGSTRSTP